MSPLPVIENTFRVALNGGLYGGVRPINVFHILCPSGDVDAIAGKIRTSSEISGLMQGRPESAKPQSMTITPLDGVSSGRVFSLNSDQFPTDTGDGQMVPEAACVISFQTGIRGPANRGRLYNGPLVEAAIQNGVVVDGVPEGLATNWETFRLALQDTGDPTCFLAVASYVHGTVFPVISLSVSSQMATQRRRLLQTR